MSRTRKTKNGEKSSVFPERNDEGDCEPLTKKTSFNKTSRHHQQIQHHHPYPHRQHLRRRMPKRYNNIIHAFSVNKISTDKDFINREQKAAFPSLPLSHSSTKIHRRQSLKVVNDAVYCFDSHRKTLQDKRDHYRNATVKDNDKLAHRMQVAIGAELMHSLDRNFVSRRRQRSTMNSAMTRTQSLNILTSSIDHKFEQNIVDDHRFELKSNSKNDNLSTNVPTPDYFGSNEGFIIKTIHTNQDIGEEPIADYDDSKSIVKLEHDEKSMVPSDPEILSSSIVPQLSLTNSEEPMSLPPAPPPLPNLTIEQQTVTLRYRTIADRLSSEHKLVLKDDVEENEKLEINQTEMCSETESKFQNFHISNNLTSSHSCQIFSYSSDNFMSQLTNHEDNLTILYRNSSIIDEQTPDFLASSSPGTSFDTPDEHCSSSSKIYNDYKKQASLASLPTTTIPSHSLVTQPAYVHVGIRSSTSSTSTNDRFTDMTLSGKQMNVCVINQLNEHLSTRLRKQQQELNVKDMNIINSGTLKTHDSPKVFITEQNNDGSNVVGDTNSLMPTINPLCPPPIPPPPPPPPPLPADGFCLKAPVIKRSVDTQRTPSMILPREVTNSSLLPINGALNMPSNLSDMRILCELRENPLFTRAKQQLEIEPGSNGRRSGRRLNGSTSNSTHNEPMNHEFASCLRFNNHHIKPNTMPSCSTQNPKDLETIIMLPNELDAILGKPIKNPHDANRVKSRSFTKSLTQTQCRQSELELIFQKRAQRSEQNLM